MNTTRTMQSWGRVSQVFTEVDCPAWSDQIRPIPSPVLAYGLGRSYGDSCLLSAGRMIETRFLDKILAFNPVTGLLRAEAGISLDAILHFCVPKGWFLPTTPGTRQVTLGGAIANDVHGKNHHRSGCFGNHVPRLELLRSDGSRQEVSTGDARHAATIGGLGLTGIIIWADLQLIPIHSTMLKVELLRFRGLDEFLVLSSDSEQFWEHSVAWIDCAATGRNLARGVFMRANWLTYGCLEPHKPPVVSVPSCFPKFALNRFSIRAFNAIYCRRFIGSTRSLEQHYASYLYPLDSIKGWSQIYGARGFFQYQMVIPAEVGVEPLREMLRHIAKSGQGSFLAVIKTFGDKPSPGMLSFPSLGITLALDFANKGEDTLHLLDRLDEIARSAGARFYPAKDARMRREDFERSYPRLEEFRSHVDPGISSEFWKRMNR